MIYLAIFLIVFNIFMWIIFGIRFHKIFSTDDIEKKLRQNLNLMLKDINYNASRNITLIEDKIKQLKSVSAEADRRLLVLKKELENTNKVNDFQKKIQKAVQKKNISVNNSQIDLFVGNSNDTISNKTDIILDDKENVMTERKNTDKIKNVTDKDESTKKSENKQNDFPDFFISPNPIKAKKEFNQIVLELKDLGFTPEQIARETSRSIQEVNLVLKLL